MRISFQALAHSVDPFLKIFLHVFLLFAKPNLVARIQQLLFIGQPFIVRVLNPAAFGAVQSTFHRLEIARIVQNSIAATMADITRSSIPARP